MNGRRAAKNTTEAGYGSGHQRLRAQYARMVEAGDALCTAAVCLRPSRIIVPGSEWHLGHLPDRSGYSGPQHALCNTSEGGRRGNPRSARPKRQRPAGDRWRPTRNW